MRIFGGERIKALMYRLGMTEGVPIESGLISRRIETAQKSVEAQNFDARKHLLEYDDVMNKQRAIIYADRRATLEGKFDSRTFMQQTLEAKVDEAVEENAPENAHPSEWDLEEMLNSDKSPEEVCRDCPELLNSLAGR